jgi:hypothetical protein
MISNRLKNTRLAFIANIKAQADISHFQGASGEPATWVDVAWTCAENDGHQCNYYFTQDVAHRFSKVSLSKPLPREKQQLLMAFTLHTTNGKNSHGHKTERVRAARSFLADISSIDDISTDSIAAYQDSVGRSPFNHITWFVRWLINNKLIQEATWDVKSPEQKTGDEVALAIKEKLPDEKIIMALGAIHHNIISPDESKWEVCALNSQRDPLVCAMVALALGSPNRVLAEQTVLNSDLLKKHSQTVKGIKETVHFLHWKGSKGFKDNNNHILSGMVPAVERSLKYIQRATEPARILARFYESPEAPLKDVLLGFTPNQENLDLLKPDFNKPIHMMALGMLIGFYEGTDKCVQVPTLTKAAEKVRRKHYWSKHIKDLTVDDVICLPNEISFKKLLGVRINAKDCAKIFPKRNLVIGDFQRAWIAYIKKNFSVFPLITNGKKNGTVDMRTAMFAFTGSQLYSRGTKAIGAKSFYFITSPQSIGTLVAMELNKSSAYHKKNIFERHGFSSDFYILTHQFRHYLNDCAERNGVPRQIINLWSGRKNPDQIVHYVHRTGAERASEVCDIIYPENAVTEEEAAKSLRVISKGEYEQLTDGIATETSSGICVQQLIYNPCTYLNDFDTQCALCSSSCHVAHDENAIALLEKDLTVQKQRMEDVQERQKFPHSQAMQGWFQTHYKNTEALEQLVTLMKAPDIKKGSLIRLVSQKNEFRITDLERKTVNIHSLKLVDANQALQLALELKTPKQDVDFLDLLGVI